VLGDPTLAKLAEKYGRSPAQVVLRWHVQIRNIVFPKSVNSRPDAREHQRVRLRAVGRDLAAVEGLNRDQRNGPDPNLRSLRRVTAHPDASRDDGWVSYALTLVPALDRPDLLAGPVRTPWPASAPVRTRQVADILRAGEPLRALAGRGGRPNSSDPAPTRRANGRSAPDRPADPADPVRGRGSVRSSPIIVAMRPGELSHASSDRRCRVGSVALVAVQPSTAARSSPTARSRTR